MMFWRLLGRLLRANQGRLTVALVALVSGAAVSSALINLHLDAERKLTREFRALGANVVASPGGGSSQMEAPLMDAAVMERIAALRTPDTLAAAPYLYVVARVGEERRVVLAGTWLDEVRRMASWWKVEGNWITDRNDLARCLLGRNVARQLGLAPGALIELRYADRAQRLSVAGVVSTGSAEDNQVFVSLPVAQQLAGLHDRISMVQLSVAGSAERIRERVSRLSEALPGLEVRPIRQLAEAEGRLLGRIRVLIFSTVVLILVLTALCVMATMAALALERRRDVGLMKAIGGPMSRVVRLFLAEAGILGALGGIFGYVGGIFLSRWIGQRVFGAALSARPEVLPLMVALMVAVALAGALPLRLLTQVRPAVILRGE